MKMTVAELAEKLGLPYDRCGADGGADSVDGDVDVDVGDQIITHACGLEGSAGGISYVESDRFVKQALQSQATAFICRDSVVLPGKTRLLAEFPDMAIVAAAKLLHPAKVHAPGVHPSVVMGEDCRIGVGVCLMQNVVLGDRVRLGANTVLMAGVVVDDDSALGEDCLVHPGVVIRHETTIGNRVIINANAAIGADGFGFVTHQGRHHKIPQVGTVRIGDDVEIGACNTIDRGRFGETVIGSGTKLDNLVHVGHNVELGEHSLAVGMVGFAGSTKTGSHLVMGGQSMLAGHLEIGSNVTVSAKTCLAKSVGDGGRYSGIPARPHKEWLRASSQMYNLDAVFDFIKEVKARFKREDEKQAARGMGD